MEAKMRISEDMTYNDLDLVELAEEARETSGGHNRHKVPFPEDPSNLKLRCKVTGEQYTFSTQEELREFKYHRYIRKYVQCVHSIDENIGRMLDWLDEKGLSENTMVIYTSDQGFFLGEHGWYDKRFIYEESFQMPFLLRYPKKVKPGSVNKDMVCNVDFAPTWLELAGVPAPNYMQGRSILPLCEGETPSDWTDLAYHRY
jgi:arylsulfatase A-like enzyme